MSEGVPPDGVEAGTEPDPVRWLDEEEQRAWRAILRATHMINQAMEQALDEHEVSLGEYELISMLSEAPGGRMRMAALADLVVQSRSRVSHTATRLQRRGWVARTRSIKDARGVLLELTDQGWERVEALAPVHVASVRAALLDHMTRAELLEHGAIMRQVILATRHSEDEASDAV